MTKGPSRKLLKAFDLIEVIQMHVSKLEVAIVCHWRTSRGIVIQSHFGEWEAAAV